MKFRVYNVYVKNKEII